MLAAKGFPPRICQIVRAIHTCTSVRFLANGNVSDELLVTTGIRQVCPLAPLLFIIAVDLLYDVIETDSSLTGIVISENMGCPPLKVAGYADDTAIYVADSRMQDAALRVVHHFSAVSGLKLNVKKSAVINIWDSEPAEHAGLKDRSGLVESMQCTRYLGHIAGSADTTEEAWSRAFDALCVRLALAEAKTNTVQKRGQIATAIIIPKLLYVARHSWPTEAIIKRAERRIRNFVWKTSFTNPERAPSRWLQADLAEQTAARGGIGVPNFRTELMAVSAAVVGEWALTFSS
jgi:hypothetical protein